MVGFGAGVLYAVARRAWADLGTVKRAVGTTNRAAWLRTRELIVLGFLLAIAAALALNGITER